MTSLLEARGLALPDRLHLTDLTVDAGALVAVVGPNGGGKTSLLRAIAGVDGSSGRVAIDGEAVADAAPARRRRLLSFLPAARDVAWPIPARDVIALGLDRPDEARVEELLGMLSLGSLADRPIDKLSTGERARALLARALAPRPRLLLLDEPLSNLDPYWVLATLEILRAQARSGAALLVALHDLALLDRFDRALLVADGRVQGDARPRDIIAAPAFAEHFGVEPDGAGWKIRQADPRSSR